MVRPTRTTRRFVHADALIVFGHGNGMLGPRSYVFLIQHIASRGYAVVYSPYTIDSDMHADRYAVLPSIARRALVERGWGTRGAFLFAMAPRYPLQIMPGAAAPVP